jgi:hypothetical protein
LSAAGFIRERVVEGELPPEEAAGLEGGVGVSE